MKSMGSNHVPGGRSHDSERDGKQVVVKRLEGEVVPGDCIWVKLCSKLWWPAQVVNENTVSESNKPCSRAAGTVLVRLYGSYEYLYADPIKFQSEFQIVLKENNGSHREIFEKSLEQVCSRKRSKFTGKCRSTRPSAVEEVKYNYSKQGSRHKKHKPNSPGAEQESKSHKQDEVQEKMKAYNTSNGKRRMSEISMHSEDIRRGTPKPNEKHNLSSPSSATSLFKESHELSTRRLRVMQSLALIAPSGSPFSKKGHIYENLHN
ncbi:PWWP domain containing protein [Melia azedarach]|uniref:PWWP domain containing protein n=1 Tax=Melia azedarach TaxID=155640 RepID=A0ACC1WQX9_MELAZ|nr:PWWP domain containing protein [Melia azedarach]